MIKPEKGYKLFFYEWCVTEYMAEDGRDGIEKSEKWYEDEIRDIVHTSFTPEELEGIGKLTEDYPCYYRHPFELPFPGDDVGYDKLLDENIYAKALQDKYLKYQ